MDPLLLLVLLAVVLVAGFTQGTTGFGFGLLAMSVLPLCLDVREAVPLVSVLGLVVCVTVLARGFGHVEWRRVLPLLVGEALGTPLGVLFLTAVDRRVVTALLGIVLLVYGVGGLLRGPGASTPPPAEPAPLRGVLAGFAAGVLGGAFNTGGPPVVLYATWRRWKPAAFRANLQVVFLFNTAIQLTLFAASGLLTTRVLTLDAIALPALLVGVILGTVAASSLDAVRFRRIVLGLLAAFGVVFLARALGLV